MSEQRSSAVSSGRGVSRRSILKGAVGASVAGAVCPFTGARAATAGTAATAPNVAIVHSSFQRGLDVAAVLGRGTEGRYGLMFKSCRAYTAPDDLLIALADSMLDPRTPQPDPDRHDQWDNFDISGGYTFLGQFLDHDMTRDTTPLAEARRDPYGTANFDTPFLDLGSVYGRGPGLDPQLYEADRKHLVISYADGVPDLPRDANGTAYLGDPRNDENLIVSQLHVAFLGFHNHLIDAGLTFSRARKIARWEYQHLVVEEFLGRIVGRDVVHGMLETGPKGLRVARPRYWPKDRRNPMMPIEYAAAAYRFGHSMVRPEYEVNDSHTLPIFATDGDDLRGSRAVPASYHVDWSYFFDIPGTPRPDGMNFSRLIDSRLAAGLHTLPPTVQQDGVVNLAARNLLRGARVGVPSGQAVARQLGVTPLTNRELELKDPRWGGQAPLWFYVLKEAELVNGGRRLGPVGGRIVAVTILRLLEIDNGSYFNVPGGYVPQYATVGDFLLAAGTGRKMRPEEPPEPEPEPEAEAEQETAG